MQLLNVRMKQIFYLMEWNTKESYRDCDEVVGVEECRQDQPSPWFNSVPFTCAVCWVQGVILTLAIDSNMAYKEFILSVMVFTFLWVLRRCVEWSRDLVSREATRTRCIAQFRLKQRQRQTFFMAATLSGFIWDVKSGSRILGSAGKHSRCCVTSSSHPLKEEWWQDSHYQSSTELLQHSGG